MENPGVHSALLLQVLLRASEAAGSEHANPDPGKGAFSSPPPSATETWPCHLKNFEAVQNWSLDFVILVESKLLDMYCVNPYVLLYVDIKW